MSVNLEIERISPKLLRALKGDLNKAAQVLDKDEVRYLVDLYYAVQKFRISAGNQTRALEAAEGAEAPEPNTLVTWVGQEMKAIEDTIKSAMDCYARTTEVGRWSMGQRGVGPVLAAGLLAHIDITRAPSASHIWSFAGLNPNAKWEKGKKRPWNARLKVLQWKLGDSFVKVSGRDDAFYGKLYRQRKEQEVARNEALAFADQAKTTLAEKKFRDSATKLAYEAGKLPPGRIDLRARRVAVKLFLAHWHEVAFREHYKKDPPRPWAIEHGGHVDYIPPPAPVKTVTAPDED